MHAVPQVFLSDNVRRVGMKRWGYGRWELCSPEEKEEEEAQEEAREVEGEGRWKHSIIKRSKRWRKEEEDRGTAGAADTASSSRRGLRQIGSRIAPPLQPQPQQQRRPRPRGSVAPLLPQPRPIAPPTWISQPTRMPPQRRAQQQQEESEGADWGQEDEEEEVEENDDEEGIQ